MITFKQKKRYYNNNFYINQQSKMNKLILFAGILFLIGCSPKNNQQKTISPQINNDMNEVNNNIVTFPSKDGLEITAKLYEINKSAPVILLCHQARFSKFEYEGIAQRLNSLGFNCVATDQRSGGPIANQVNETTIRAKKAGKPIGFLDAEQDMVAAIDWVHQRYQKPVTLWGSSYSSTLALYIAAKNEKVGSVVSFSPGNYFADKKGSLIDLLEDFKKPMFVTSSKYEAEKLGELVAKMEFSDKQVMFTPEEDGHHGSRALWKDQNGGAEYWEAIIAFLNRIK